MKLFGGVSSYLHPVRVICISCQVSRNGSERYIDRVVGYIRIFAGDRTVLYLL